MSTQRKQHKPEFKAKVAIAALRGDETTSQLSSRFGVHSTMISGWKRTLVEDAASLFEKAGRIDDRKDLEATIDELYRQIGQLKVERDFLSKKLAS
ncbi:MAG: transposase [Magnetococcales bacterium]|nr:transposase [Magnetococcales bacterium]